MWVSHIAFSTERCTLGMLTSDRSVRCVWLTGKDLLFSAVTYDFQRFWRCGQSFQVRSLGEDAVLVIVASMSVKTAASAPLSELHPLTFS